MPQITQDQKNRLTAYLDDRYSMQKIAMYACLGATVVFGGVGLSNYLSRKRLAERLSHLSTTLTGEGTSTRVDLGGWLMLGILFGIAFVVLVVLGWQKTYGTTAKKCLQAGAYTCEYIMVSSKGEDKGKAPYFIKDTLGNELECPVYLDFKNAAPGMQMVGVFMENGQKYVFRDAETVEAY